MYFIYWKGLLVLGCEANTASTRLHYLSGLFSSRMEFRYAHDKLISMRQAEAIAGHHQVEK